MNLVEADESSMKQEGTEERWKPIKDVFVITSSYKLKWAQLR